MKKTIAIVEKRLFNNMLLLTLFWMGSIYRIQTVDASIPYSACGSYSCALNCELSRVLGNQKEFFKLHISFDALYVGGAKTNGNFEGSKIESGYNFTIPESSRSYDNGSGQNVFGKDLNGFTVRDSRSGANGSSNAKYAVSNGNAQGVTVQFDFNRKTITRSGDGPTETLQIDHCDQLSDF